MNVADAASAAIAVELLKVRRSKVLLVSIGTAVVFPLLIGFVMSGAFGVDSPVAPEVEQTVSSYMAQFEIVVAVGGMIGFGFLFSWIFGRESTDGTVTDLLSLPISRVNIVVAKFIVAVVWCAVLALLHFIVGGLFAWTVLQDAATAAFVWLAFRKFVVTVAMVIFLSMPVAFVASVGRGYMAPLGFVILTIVTAQLLSSVGVANYFPWAVPGLFSGIVGRGAMQLSPVSIALPFVTGLLGLTATLVWWRYADFT